MGNQIAGQSQNQQAYQNAMANNPQFVTGDNKSSPNSKTFTQLRYNRFLRGDQNNNLNNSRGYAMSPNNYLYDSMALRENQYNPITSAVMPVQNPNVDIPQVMYSGHINQMTSNHSGSRVSEEGKKQSPGPFSFLQQIFGQNKTPKMVKLRSSSANHNLMSNSQQKLVNLQRTLNFSQNKAKNLQQQLKGSRVQLNLLQSKAQQAQSLLSHTQSKLSQTAAHLNQIQSKLAQSQATKFQVEQNLNNTHQRVNFLESKINGSNQEIGRLRNLLAEKERVIKQLELQIYTCRSQIQLQENRLNQANSREERKDKEILELTSTKFELNSLKIRLQNNIKILQDQLQHNSQKIKQLDQTIQHRTKQLQQKNQIHNELNQKLFQQSSTSESVINKHLQQIHILSLTIKGQEAHMQQNQQKYIQLTKKLDRCQKNQVQNQAIIGNLESAIAEGREKERLLELETQRLEAEITRLEARIGQVVANAQAQNMEVFRNKELNQKMVKDFANAKKVGQKQIQFLETKIQEAVRQKQKLAQQLQIAKNMPIQQNRVFQRTVIYELKKQNDRLWKKLIQLSDKQAVLIETNNQQYWKKRIQDQKNSKKQPKYVETDLNKQKNQLQMRYENFIKKLSQNSDVMQKTMESEVNNHSFQRLNDNVSFYREKCNQLEKMVQSHIIINRNLKDQIQKNLDYQSSYKRLQNQLLQARKSQSALTTQCKSLQQQLTTILPQHQLTQIRQQNRINQLQSQNKRYFADLQKYKRNLETALAQAKRGKDQVRRLGNEIAVYKKWEDMYEDVKGRYDELMGDRRQDYRGMYEALGLQMERLRGLYNMREKDYQKMNQMNIQKHNQSQKQINQKQQIITQQKIDLQNLYRQSQLTKQQYQTFTTSIQHLQSQISKSIQQKQQIQINRQQLHRVINILKDRITELRQILKQIVYNFNSQSQADRGRIPEIVEFCEGLLERALTECQSIVGYN